MLTVPDEIKDLLHLDTCKKNIRIHFPNGERSDVCNDLIVKDSVKFTESLCSQDTLKFGLCEASVFECETVGVGNIKGATIDVSCEIYCEPTVSGAVFKTDIQHYVYVIPYGTFVVNEAKRQADMIHRRIVAYTKIASDNWDIVNIEKIKPNIGNLYTPKIAYWLAGNGADIIAPYCDIEAHDWTTLDYGQHDDYFKIDTSFETHHVVSPVHNLIVGFSGCSIVWTKTPMSGRHLITFDDFDKLFKVKKNNNYVWDNVASQIKNYMGSFSSDYFDSSSPITSQIDKAIAYVKKYINGFVTYEDGLNGTLTFKSSPLENEYFYPFCNGFYRTAEYKGLMWLSIPTQVKITAKYNSATEDSISIDLVSEHPELFKLTIKDDYSFIGDLSLSLFTQETQSSLASVVWDYPIWENTSVLKQANALTELLGVFFKWDRNNANRIVNLKKQFELTPSQTLYPGSSTYPAGVTGGELLPGDYQTCWYEDEYTKPFGAVICGFKNANNDDVLFTLYLTGYDKNSDINTYQTYDLSENEIIRSSTWTESQIQEFCAVIASNIEGVTYMPVDFVGRGLPYVEAGDTFEILTKSNDSITTIVLNKTTSGEQTLTDSYKSV